MKALLMALSLVALTGCAAFEQTPQDVQQKLSDPTRGKLYVPEPGPGQ